MKSRWLAPLSVTLMALGACETSEGYEKVLESYVGTSEPALIGKWGIKIEDMTPSYWEKSTFLPSPSDDINEHKDLIFKKPVVYGNNSRWINQIFFPNDKKGPFPVIVIMGDCGGVGLHNLDFMRKAFQREYAAIVLDTHRGFSRNCANSMNKPVKWLRMTKDAYDVAEFLSTLPNIDKNRIYSLGGSEGGMIGGFLSSPGIKKFTAPDAPRYRASASFYGCAVFPPGSSSPNQIKPHMYIFNDMDKPLLWLMGDADNECNIEAELQIISDFQKNKLPLEYHLYNSASHCWDCKAKDGLRQTLWRFGSPVTVIYKYNQKIADDSAMRVLNFFDRHK